LTVEGKSHGALNRTLDEKRPMSQSVFFKSTTDRFVKIDDKNPNIRIIEGPEAKMRLLSAVT